MTTYTAYFHTDADYAARKFVADTPEQALEKARRFYDHDPSDLTFESYNDVMPVNEITIHDADCTKLAVWFDDDMRLRLAARDLLNALEQAVAALNEAPRFAMPGLSTDSYRIASICDKAIAKAKGGAA
jgi:hypothetical protein